MTSNRKSSTARKKRPTGKEYVIVSYLCMCLFVAMIGYMIYFQVGKSEELLSSPYNQRQTGSAKDVTRGSILSSDGHILAYTDTDSDDGSETRVYPLGSLFSQVIGYSDYGSSGLEAVQSYRLLDSHQSMTQQIQNSLNGEKNVGDSLITTLDVSLQQAASDALGDNTGAAIVLDAKTGDVLADVSSPGFDPNTIADDWDDLNSDDSGSPFLNRATQGLYAPGSTFKIVTALTYLREHGTFDDFSFECTGEYTEGNYTIHCVNNTVHGTENFADAFANSCNCAFSYMISQLMDKSDLQDVAESLGFNTDPNLLIPDSVSKFALDDNTSVELAMQTAIGQGDTQASPVQMAMIAQAIANGGEMLRPNFVKQVISSDHTITASDTTETIGEVTVVAEDSADSLGKVLSEDEAASLTSLMEEVVNRGTGTDLSDLGYQVAGKTGTAQYGNIEDDTAHSWFVGFSETGNSDIVVAVIVEGGGNGVAPAIPVAKSIFQAKFG